MITSQVRLPKRPEGEIIEEGIPNLFATLFGILTIILFFSIFLIHIIHQCK